MHKKDYLRFIANLYEFNSHTPALNFGYQHKRDPIEVRLQYERKGQLVEILAFCLMPNHYHLMVRQLSEDGITEFMRKLGTGYTNYFNLKYNRVGPLFQGKFKSILLTRQEHLCYLPHYIHLNPLELVYKSAPNHAQKNTFTEVLRFLNTYRWSSLQDYLGKKNFPSITERNFLTTLIGGPQEFLESTREWLEGKYDSIEKDVAIDPIEVGLR